MNNLKKILAFACALTLLSVSILSVGCSNDQDGSSYAITFVSDGNVKVYVYETQNYDVEPVLTNTAYARDGETGELVGNGEGQVNFKLVFDEGYSLDEISVSQGYKDLKYPSEAGQADVYRITEITNDITVSIKSKREIYLPQFGSSTAKNGAIEFSWQKNESVAKVDVSIKAAGLDEAATVLSGQSFSYELQPDKLYSFAFTPYDADGTAGKVVNCTRFFSLEAAEISVPRVEIVTQDNVFPDCDTILPPQGSFGIGITNAFYVQSVVNLYDKDGALLYASGNADDYSGAKVKARGNTSAQGEKKPYKIKLNKKYDLLNGLIEGRTDKSYADKNWILLATANTFNTAIGWSVSESLEMDFTPSYAYVSVFVNGDYRGMYILTESVKEGNGSGDSQSRVPVDEDGFIIELDAYWWNEDLYFETSYTKGNGMKWTFKYPDTDDINEQSTQYLYIRQYIIDFESALLADDESYLNYIDADSVAKWIFGRDLLGTYSEYGSNIYMTKKDGSNDTKLRMGVMWDFDGIMHIGATEACVDTGAYAPKLMQKESFVSVYKTVIDEYAARIADDLTANLNGINSNVFDELLRAESKRWNVNRSSADEQKAAAISWISTRIDWLRSNFK